MDIVLNIETNFNSVFLVNGRFFEHAKIRVDSEDILYVTVLPLDATLSPYTVKLLGHRPLSGAELCLTYKLTEQQYYIRMLKRYNYIYSSKKQHEPSSSGSVFKLFKNVKEKNYIEARLLMSESLSASIDNNSLDAFFEDFSDIVENKGYVAAPFGSHFLIDSKGTAAIFVFETKGGLIDNIYEFKE